MPATSEVERCTCSEGLGAWRHEESCPAFVADVDARPVAGVRSKRAHPSSYRADLPLVARRAHLPAIGEVTERPILMSGAMVRATLRDLDPKTQTRRVVKDQLLSGTEMVRCSPDSISWDEQFPEIPLGGGQSLPGRIRRTHTCPYGKIGDRLWVRETWAAWAVVGAGDIWRFKYAADGKEDTMRVPIDWEPPKCLSKNDTANAPSIFMPRWAARLTMEITGIRVERLQEMNADAAIAEGIPSRGIEPPCIASALMYLHDFETLWNSLNAKRGFGWDVNPWVWVLELRRIGA